MKYNVEALKNMIEVYNSNISSFQNSLMNIINDPVVSSHRVSEMIEYYEIKLSEMVSNRRLVAAMIENDGQEVSSVRNGNVFFDNMLYAANLPGADTSTWTKGT